MISTTHPGWTRLSVGVPLAAITLAMTPGFMKADERAAPIDVGSRLGYDSTDAEPEHVVFDALRYGNDKDPHGGQDGQRRLTCPP